MGVFIELLVLLAAARIVGEVAVRCGQPAAVGEILAGVMIALSLPFLVPMFPGAALFGQEEATQVLATFGMFFLMLHAGGEMDPAELTSASFGAVLVALGGIVLPLLAGFGFGLWYLPEGPHTYAQALVLGVAMSITSIPASIRILEELNLLHTRLGRTIVAAALIDDIAGIILLAVVTAIIQHGMVPNVFDLALLLGKVAAFFVIAAVIGAHLYEWISHAMKRMEAAALEFSALLGMALFYGALAETLGMHWIVGAFMAGLYFDRKRVGRKVFNEMAIVFEVLVRGLMAPLFFLTVGLQVDVAVFGEAPMLIVALTVIGFATKFVGAGFPALGRGFTPRETAAIGSGMSSKGAVEMVILGIVADAGVFAGAGRYVFSALVIMATLNTLAAPILVRRLIAKETVD